jgi:putative transposase
VTFLCARLGVSRASFYRWVQARDRPPKPRAARRQRLTTAIVATFAETDGRAGRRPIKQLLAQQDLPCALGTVQTIMAEQHLTARRRRAWKRTTTTDPAARTAHIRNHCLDEQGRRCFASAEPGTRTVGDITVIPTDAGWLSLAVGLDLATRAVVGWAMKSQMPTELVIDALTMATTHQRLRPGAIFPSDRGTQYTADAFQTACTAHTVTQSLGTTGVCWDNAVAESFFATRKGDLSGAGRFATHREARQWLVLWIEDWDNRRRPHRANNGQPPMTAWSLLQSARDTVSHS